MPEHAISVIEIGSDDERPRYRAYCSCAWKGIRTHNRQVAEAQAEQHLKYQAEVAVITRTGSRVGRVEAGR